MGSSFGTHFIYYCNRLLSKFDFVDFPHAQKSLSKLDFSLTYSASFPSEPRTFTIL